MRPLAVDDGGHVVARMLVHGSPHFGDPRARGVDHRHPLLVEHLHLLERGAKRRQDDYVTVLDVREALALLGLLDEVDVHVLQKVIHPRIVDQLVRDVHPLVRVSIPRRPRKLNRALDAPAESVVLCEAECDGALGFSARDLTERCIAHLGDQLRGELLAHLARDIRVNPFVKRSIPSLVPLLRHDAPALGALVERARRRGGRRAHRHAAAGGRDELQPRGAAKKQRDGGGGGGHSRSPSSSPSQPR
mmetsp:Transcript_12503/g.36111  ORF Transcript_12503/g.36111 Transcript_12503/m.36111 type:complete len:247 (-) Transcript_12503:6-746(-)